jgi:hypothetical protein
MEIARFWGSAALIGLALGCGGDDGGQVPSVVALLDQWVAQYDRQMSAQCECLTAAGAYPSHDACMADFGSGPGWSECATMLIEDGSIELDDEQAKCVIDEMAHQADCMERSQCGTAEFYECMQGESRCPAPDDDLILTVIEACPDTGLLSRFTEGD